MESKPEVKFKVGDRVVHVGSKNSIGTVCESPFPEDYPDVPVRWDHVDYDEYYRYSLPRKLIIRKLTKLEQALK